ncbi:aminotransferase class I/II-fold pyridoxal phosphate-dependent enzyme [Aminobacter aminovorans]|jgi:DNA-binding transcriptional MocR family regulator|nr:PLP-dependent aminotransferase family protein [Aminobacter aminovorans]
MVDRYDAQWFADRLGDRTSRGIALETGAMIRSGLLPVGTKLPSVRDLAFRLGISPATVSIAWADLRRHKVIGGRGRNGAWVMGDRFAPRPTRLVSSGNYGPDVLNLGLASPDVELLPSLEQALVHGAKASHLNSYERVRILPELEAVVRPTWPYDPGAFLVTNGGYNAVYTLLHALVTPGAPVAIEDPTALRLLDILEDLNVPIIPVACDGLGPIPEALAEAMKASPVAFLFQPRVHSVTGTSLTRERLEALGDVLEGSGALIIEDDGVGDVSEAARHSLGRRFPDRVIHILSYSKTLGPDLRLAVLSSSASVVEQIQSYRSFSAGWTSRILQAATSWLLQDGETENVVRRARAAYRERRHALAGALFEHGLEINAGDGLSVLVPVESENYALITLASRGIAVSAGSRFSTKPTSSVRVATSVLQLSEVHRVADAISAAAATPR